MGIIPVLLQCLYFSFLFLTLRGKSKKEMLIVGILFTVGIGVSYLLLGVGLFELISRWKYFEYISKYVYLATAVITFVLVVVTISDYIKARRGQVSDMTLQLSTTEKGQFTLS